MDHRGTHILPKDTHVVKDAPVRDVADYIKRVNQYIQIKPNSVFVYRGEPKAYDRPCIPNIYRDGLLRENKFFEKSLFEAMRQNRLTGESRYLENAIDAQHGEFPSRLLDVSYNCLTALYFAVTPYYHKPEDFYDKENGMVYVFFIDEMFSPSSQNANQYYNAIINHNPKWIDMGLFEKNHKFIDHVKLNDRIIAQQGAFILFQGDSPEELPRYMYYGIEISGECKAQIRQELKQLFGIHTGSIYPETVNLVGELKDKSTHLNTKDFSFENELDNVLKQLEKELDYYLGYAVDQRRKGAPNMEQIIIYIEKLINSYRSGFLALYQNSPEEGHDVLMKAGRKYQHLIQSFSERMKEQDIGPFSGEKLQRLW